MSRPMTAKFPGKCAGCGQSFAAGTRIVWDSDSKETKHESCDVKQPVVNAPATIFAPTSEQTLALEYFATGDSLAIEAGAGTGKTSTLKLLAESTKLRGQYIAFNRAIVKEANEKMPSNISAKTAHSLAMSAVGNIYRHRLDSRRMRSLDIAHRLGISQVQVDGGKFVSASFLGGYVMAAVVKFCQSADLEPTVRHCPYIEGIDAMVDGQRGFANNNHVAKSMLPYVKKAWADLMNPHGDLPYRHDHYLKAWQLSNPKIGADFILFDEAQDANPVIVDIVSQQTHAQLVWVGDSQQQIYTFTGAVNALANVPSDRKAFLTQSFRFGPQIADVANDILTRLDAELRIVGTDSILSTVGPVADPDAILTRTNAAAVRTVLNLQGAGDRPALVGGGEEVVRFAKAADELRVHGSTEHPDLACFASWGEVQQYVVEDQLGGELKLNVDLVDDFGTQQILDALDRPVREQDASTVISTAHKSKGREWNAVQLGADFPSDEEKLTADELRLLYVACTRARRELDIDAVVALKETN